MVIGCMDVWVHGRYECMSACDYRFLDECERRGMPDGIASWMRMSLYSK